VGAVEAVPGAVGMLEGSEIADIPRGSAATSLQTILVPVDGSSFAEIALLPAREIAARAHASLVIAQAVVPENIPGVSPELSVQLAETDSLASLAHAARHLEPCEVPISQFTILPREGEGISVAQAIVTAIESTQADLVVMCTHGRTGLSRAVVGSVAEAVIHHSRVPVLLYHPRTEGEGRLRSAPERNVACASASLPPCVMVALDGSPQAEASIDPAVSLARLLNAGIELIQVVPQGNLLFGPSYGYTVARPLARTYLSDVAERLLAQHAGLPFVRTAVRIADSDRVAATVVAHAEERNASAIAVVTHARSGLPRLLFGSVTAGIVGRASVGVLVVPPRV
jgi:nucleotide-binding universal stress UspA family protein